jgi:hypothetical protein
MMIALLWLGPLAADLSQTITDPAQRRAASRCEARLARAGGGEISAIDVTAFHRNGRSTTLKGTLRVLQKPKTRPGEMTPTHVIVMPYSYECRLDGDRTPRIKLAPLDN